jgi:hypothetical protein
MSLASIRVSTPTVLLSIVCLSLLAYLGLSQHRNVRTFDDDDSNSAALPFRLRMTHSQNALPAHARGGDSGVTDPEMDEGEEADERDMVPSDDDAAREAPSSSRRRSSAGAESSGSCDHSAYMLKSDVAELLRKFRISMTEKIRAAVDDEPAASPAADTAAFDAPRAHKTQAQSKSKKKSTTQQTSSEGESSGGSAGAEAAKATSGGSSSNAATAAASDQPWNNPLKPVNAWVLERGVAHLFDWTWLRNGAYTRHLQKLSTLSKNSHFSPSGMAVVNDARDYLSKNADVGVIVDDFPQLPNPVPHPLPRTASTISWNEMCGRLNIASQWLACKISPEQLSTAMPYTTRFVNVAVYNGFVDSGSCHEAVPGTLFSNRATFHFQRWTNNGCHNGPIGGTRGSIVEHDEVADSLGTYASAFGHFPNQQMPRLLRMLATASNTTKALVAQGGIADALMDLLVERKVITPDRIVRWQGGGQTHFGRVVYRSEAWPYLDGEKYGNYLHDRTDMELMHRVFIDDLPDAQRTSVVIVKRDGGRAIENHNGVVQAAEDLKTEWMKVEIFEAKGGLRDHMEMFKRARVVIAPHGAGLINLMWCKPGTHIVEVGYHTGMTLPSMYYEMASHSGHVYWLVSGRGDYASKIHVDIAEMRDVMKQIFEEIPPPA